MTETREALIIRLEGQARQLRRDLWRALRAGGSGHAGGSSSAADILTALYFHRLRVRPAEPDWPDRDRFVLSKGHANAALGAVLVNFAKTWLTGALPEVWLFALGALFIVVTLFLPRGVIGTWQHWRRQAADKKAAKTAAGAAAKTPDSPAVEGATP